VSTDSSELLSYWDSFYAGRASAAVPDVPSDFAQWVHRRVGREQTIVEFGFGTARDSVWFLRQGRTVIGYDFAQSAVDQARIAAEAFGDDGRFSPLDLYDREAVDRVTKDLRLDEPAIYGRFLIHSLAATGRHNLLDLAATVLERGGELYLEFRTGQDRKATHLFGEDHFRVYLDPALIAAEVEERGGTVTHLEEGYGLAVYKTEDPHVARLVASFSAGGHPSGP